MRTIFRFVSLLLFCGLIAPVAKAQQGGPDAFGYTWKDQTAVGGPTYQWIDISQRGTEITSLSDDNFAGPYNLGFSFDYYWNSYNSIFIGSNGYIMFDQGRNIASGTGGFPECPTPGAAATPNNYIAMFLADLTETDVLGAPVPNAHVYFYTNNVDTAIVSYVNIPFWTDENPEHYRGSNTFQVILTKANGGIKLQYEQSTGQPDQSYLAPNTVWVHRGMENVTGSVGLKFDSNVQPAQGNAIEVTRPTSSSYAVRDLQVEWVIDASNQGQHAVVNAPPLALEASVKNTGTVAIPNTELIEVRATLRDFINGDVPIFRDTVLIPAGLNPGQSETITFSKPLPLDAAGNFKLVVETLLTNDSILSNNNGQAEIIVVDTAGFLELRYDRFQFPDATAFVPGSDGLSTNLLVGTQFSFPSYPVQITDASADIFYNNVTKVLGFTMKIYDDNGAGGTPGTLLSEIRFEATDQVPLAGNRITQQKPLDAPLTVTSGTLYVSFEMDDNTDTLLYNALCVDEQGPASFRTFEVSGGLWAPYRDRANSDFAIGLQGTYLPTSISNDVASYGFRLGQSFPNPAMDRATVPFTLTTATGKAQLLVRNLLGQTVETLDLGLLGAGEHNVELNTTNYPAGVYLYTLSVGGKSLTGKLSISK